MTHVLQDPGETRTYESDWSDDLDDAISPAETVASRQWSIDPDGSPSHLAGVTSAIVTVSGLTAGTVYRLTEAATTSEGRVLEKSRTIRCEEA